MEEIWKDIPGYESLYQISNFGRVKSFREGTKFGKQKEYILKPSLITSGYHVVTLYSKERREKHQVHRLVANAFLDNPLNLPCVNHKDENKLNNRADNLEWCTYQYNNNYGTARIRARKTRNNPILQKTLDGDPIAIYASSVIAATLLGLKVHSINSWCRSGVGGGYRWERLKK